VFLRSADEFFGAIDNRTTDLQELFFISSCGAGQQNVICSAYAKQVIYTMISASEQRLPNAYVSFFPVHIGKTDFVPAPSACIQDKWSGEAVKPVHLQKAQTNLICRFNGWVYVLPRAHP
jgi:hypothetical protein